MCINCDAFFARGATFLDDLIRSRREYPGCLPSQNTMATARMIMESLQGMKAADAYDEACFALAAAVERLVALDQCGLLR
jgi:hypothetical protein